MDILTEREVKEISMEEAEQRIEAVANELSFLFRQLQRGKRITFRGYDVGQLIEANAIGLLRGSWVK